jgi:hypothetical protein
VAADQAKGRGIIELGLRPECRQAALVESNRDMQSHLRRIKRLMRQFMTEAYERELHRELTKLDKSFAEWRRGEISSGELSHRVHRYETGPSRELYKHYNHGPIDMSVAYAIVVGILDRQEAPGELLEALVRPLMFFEDMKARDQLREPG